MDSAVNHIEEVLIDIVSEGLGEKLVNIEKLPVSANSIAYKIMTENNMQYIAKKYPARQGDKRDRLMTEFSGLAFLWENGVRNIPEPVFCSREDQIGIYGFIRGNKLRPEEITADDIHMATDFLRRLHSLMNAENADKQPVASEACFSIKSYIGSVEGRLENLKNISGSSELNYMLSEYLDKGFADFFREVKHFIKEETDRLGIDIDRELRREERTLSPSDFGFHNVLKADDGKLYFIDFEYYGWDDPAKLINDFYLQPAIPVPFLFRETFLKEMQSHLGNDRELEKRLPSVYLLLALKWCLIILNIFLGPADSRKYNEKACLRQLKKAKEKLQVTRYEFESRVFPFSLN